LVPPHRRRHGPGRRRPSQLLEQRSSSSRSRLAVRMVACAIGGAIILADTPFTGARTLNGSPAVAQAQEVTVDTKARRLPESAHQLPLPLRSLLNERTWLN